MLEWKSAGNGFKDREIFLIGRIAGMRPLVDRPVAIHFIGRGCHDQEPGVPVPEFSVRVLVSLEERAVPARLAILAKEHIHCLARQVILVICRPGICRVPVPQHIQHKMLVKDHTRDSSQVYAVVHLVVAWMQCGVLLNECTRCIDACIHVFFMITQSMVFSPRTFKKSKPGNQRTNHILYCLYSFQQVPKDI